MSVILFEDPKGYARIINTYSDFKEKLGQGYVWKTYYTDELEPLVYGLYLANAKSFRERYSEQVDVIDFETFKREIQPDFISNRYKDIYQFLKSIQCLRYNIEIDIKKEDNVSIIRGIEFLNDLIHGLESIIIRSHSEYEQAQYGL